MVDEEEWEDAEEEEEEGEGEEEGARKEIHACIPVQASQWRLVPYLTLTLIP